MKKSLFYNYIQILFVRPTAKSTEGSHLHFVSNGTSNCLFHTRNRYDLSKSVCIFTLCMMSLVCFRNPLQQSRLGKGALHLRGSSTTLSILVTCYVRWSMYALYESSYTGTAQLSSTSSICERLIICSLVYVICKTVYDSSQNKRKVDNQKSCVCNLQFVQCYQSSFLYPWHTWC